MKLIEGFDSNYRYILVAARRARQLQSGAPPVVQTNSRKPCRIAQDEIRAGKVKWEIPKLAARPSRPPKSWIRLSDTTRNRAAVGLHLMTMKVALGVTGGIAAYKAAEIVRLLQDRGIRVQVIMTRAAQEFVRPLTFAALSGEKVITGMFSPGEEQPRTLIQPTSIQPSSTSPSRSRLTRCWSLPPQPTFWRSSRRALPATFSPRFISLPLLQSWSLRR